MKRLCLIFAIFILPSLGFGQFVGDTVIVYVDNRVEITASVPNFIGLKSSDVISKALFDFKNLLPEINDQLSAKVPDLVTYSKDGSLTIEPGDPKIIYLEKDGKMSNTGFRDQAILTGDNYQIVITTTDLSRLTDQHLSTCFEDVVAKLPEKNRWSTTLSYECIDDKITELNHKNNELDMLGLQFGAGGGLVKGKWVADISFGLSLGLNYKGMTRGPYISSNMVFDFDAENKMNINTFINVGYKWNIYKKAENPNMLGIDIGYLIVKQGDLFGENTFKLSFNWSPAKFIEVSPQLYITDNFKQAFPGIRVGFGF